MIAIPFFLLMFVCIMPLRLLYGGDEPLWQIMLFIVLLSIAVGMSEPPTDYKKKKKH